MAAKVRMLSASWKRTPLPVLTKKTAISLPKKLLSKLPFDSAEDLFSFIELFRYKIHDDIVIYTGYTKDELEEKGILTKLKKYDNIIIKYGRFIPNQEPHFDEVLGVKLASDNQYAERIS